MAEILNQNPPNITDLSHELLCHILQYLPLKETLSVSILCRKLSSAVDMHLRLCKCVDFCQGKIYGYMPSSITDDHMHYLLRKCPHLETVYGLHPQKVERRRLRKRSALTVPGIIEALSLCSNLKAIETCDLRLLEAIMQHLPQLEIIGHFRNRDGVFPPHASQRLKLQPYPRISSLHLIGVEVPELTAMPHLEHLHLQCVRFTKLQPFRAFLAQNLKTFVMKHCMGPSMSLRYLSLIIALSSSPSLSRLELVRVPLVGGLFQRAVEDSYRHNGFVNLKTLVIAGCKGVLEADLGHLMIVASKNLESLFIQPSLTKDSLFVSLSFAQCEFPKLKNLHLGFVDKLNSSGEWSNDVLLTIGLAEVPDTPSSLTDSGMKVISELFPNIKTMSVSNCPHLMAMDQWSPGEGGQAWKGLTDLTLQRCHCLQLPSFALFLALLPKIEVVILNDMFREPPKGCSHVGLSAGTGLGMSSAVVSNQDEHIAVQGHQQDFEPQADEQLLENEEIEGDYIEIDNEFHHEPHLMVMEQDFFDEQNNPLPTPAQLRENLNGRNRSDMIDEPYVEENNREAQQYLNEEQPDVFKENVSNERDEDLDYYPDISQPSTSRERNLPRKKGTGKSISTSSADGKNQELKKKNMTYPARQTYRRRCKENKQFVSDENRLENVLPSTSHSNSVLKNDDEVISVCDKNPPVPLQSAEVVKSELESPSSRKQSLRSFDQGKQNTCECLETDEHSSYLRSRSFDPHQPSTSKAGNYINYSSSSSDSEVIGKNFKSSTNKLSGKRPIKVSSQSRINYSKKVRKSDNSSSASAGNIHENNIKREENEDSFSDKSSTNNEVFEGPLTRHRKKMLASGVKPQHLSYSKKNLANSKIIHGRQYNIPKHEKTNTSCIKIEKYDSNLSSSSSDEEYERPRNYGICSGVLPARPGLNDKNSSRNKHRHSSSYSRYQNSYSHMSNVENRVVNSADSKLPVHNRETSNSCVQPSVPIHSSSSNYCRGNEVSIKQELKTRNPNTKKKRNDSLKCETEKIIKNKKAPQPNQRPLTRHQERMLSGHEELDAISEGTQATSADIRRSVRRQKTSGNRPKKGGNPQAASHSTPRNDSKISAREEHKRYKQSGSHLDVQNKATSTSDPLLEDDAVQTLRLVSETLISLTIVSCGISDVVIDHCHSMTHIEVQACRILKKFQLHYCPSLKRLNISQCPKLSAEVLYPEVLSLITDGCLLVSFEPCMQDYHSVEGEKIVFSTALSDQTVVLFHDFIDISNENAEAVCKENLLGWVELLQRITNSLVFPKTKLKKKKLKSDEPARIKYPWAHELQRLYGHYGFLQLDEWRYQILTNSYLFKAAVELVDWNKGFPGPETFKDYNTIFTLVYEAVERHLRIQKKITAIYVPMTENN